MWLSIIAPQYPSASWRCIFACECYMTYDVFCDVFGRRFLTQAVSIHCCSTLCSLIKTIHVAKQVVQNPKCGQCTSGMCCGTNNEYFINFWAEKKSFNDYYLLSMFFFASFMLISTTNDMYHKMYTISFNCSSQKA